MGVNTINATSADAMYLSVMQHINQQDIFIAVAAVADYSPSQKSTQKIKKSEQSLTIELKPNKDILADVASLPSPPFCVGFAAESEHLLEYAEQKRQRKKIPLIAANIATEAMGSDENHITLLDNKGTHPLPRASKIQVARWLLVHVAQML
jgi:phosphopantothenoylcysteine decarboxylase / phosphopantothenate---cysteine ligase